MDPRLNINHSAGQMAHLHWMQWQAAAAISTGGPNRPGLPGGTTGSGGTIGSGFHFDANLVIAYLRTIMDPIERAAIAISRYGTRTDYLYKLYERDWTPGDPVAPTFDHERRPILEAMETDNLFSQGKHRSRWTRVGPGFETPWWDAPVASWFAARASAAGLACTESREFYVERSTRVFGSVKKDSLGSLPCWIIPNGHWGQYHYTPLVVLEDGRTANHAMSGSLRLYKSGNEAAVNWFGLATMADLLGLGADAPSGLVASGDAV